LIPRLYLSCIDLLPPTSTLFPYTTLFRSIERERRDHAADLRCPERATVPQPDRVHPSIRLGLGGGVQPILVEEWARADGAVHVRSEEHTSELQSRVDIVCRLLLEKKRYYR